MRLRSILSEALRNTLTGTSRALTFAVALTAVAGGLATADTMTLASLELEASTFHDSGGSTYILNADKGVSGRACQQLASIDGIEASGAMRTADTRLDLMALPGAAIPIIEITAGFPRVLGTNPDAEPSGILVSPDVATALDAQAGHELTLADGTAAHVAGRFAYPDDGRLQALRYAVLAPVPPDGVFDQCWASIWPPNSDTKSLLSTALTGDAAAADVAIGQLNTTHGATFDGPASFHARLTSAATAVAAIAGALLGYLAVRMRRLELASALHARVPKTALLVLLAIETAAWAAAAAGAALAAAWIASRTLDAVHCSEIASVAFRPIIAGASASVIGTLVGGLLTRERQLFRYFKER